MRRDLQGEKLATVRGTLFCACPGFCLPSFLPPRLPGGIPPITSFDRDERRGDKRKGVEEQKKKKESVPIEKKRRILRSNSV